MYLLASLFLLPGAGMAGLGAMSGAVGVVAGLLSVEDGVTVAAVAMLLETLVMLVAGGAELDVVPVTVEFADSEISAIFL